VLELIHSLFKNQLVIRRQFFKSDVQNAVNIRHLDEIECPTGRAKKCVDLKSTLHAKHTASRTKLASHETQAYESGGVPVNFPRN
jgi:hypothetical protein